MRLDCVPDQGTLRGRQSGSGAERRDTFWGGTQTHGQGRSLASGDSLRQSANWRLRRSSSPNTRACRTRRFGGAWPRVASSLAQRHVVHSAGRRRIRRPHGGRARPRCRGARPKTASGVLRRKPGATDRRGASAHRGATVTDGTCRPASRRRTGASSMEPLVPANGERPGGG